MSVAKVRTEDDRFSLTKEEIWNLLLKKCEEKGDEASTFC